MLKTSITYTRASLVHVVLISFIVNCKHISYIALTFFIYFDDTCFEVVMSERRFIMFGWFAFFRVHMAGRVSL